MEKVRKVFTGNSRGLSLIEVIVSLALLGMISATFLGGLSSAYKVDILASERTNAESLTRSELEYVKDSTYWPFGFTYDIPGTPPPWDAGHNTLDSHYAGYSLNVACVPIDPDTGEAFPAGVDHGIQLITAEVYHQDKLVLTTSSYKVSR